MSVFAKEYAESLAQTTGMIACITDHDQVVAASGQGSRELMGKAISKELDRVITEREMKCYHTGERKILPLVENQKESSSELIVPVQSFVPVMRLVRVALVGKKCRRKIWKFRANAGKNSSRISWTSNGTIKGAVSPL